MAELTETSARMILAAAVEPGDYRIGRLLLHQSASELLAEIETLPTKLQHEISRIDRDELLLRTINCGSVFITPESARWPVGLNLLGEMAPIGLWMKGLSETAPLTVSIVGARSCTNYGESVAIEIAGDLQNYKVAVVSGGAYGIDAAAHRGAIMAQGQTIAVLAGGVDVPYPKTNSALFERILESGVLVSESPPGSPPLRHRFLIRNRIIAAWSLGTVVIEARVRSGAIATASHANNLGLDVMAVPGLIHSPTSVGCHQLIRDGATLVGSAAEIVSQLGVQKP